MYRCPNCGQKTSGDYCQWCKYPMLKGKPTRYRKSQKQEGKEAELAAKWQPKQEAEEARKAKKAEDRVKKEAEAAQKRERKKAELAAKWQPKQEAEEARKAEERVKKEAEEAQKRERKKADLAAKWQPKQEAEEARKVEETVGAELYEGIVKLTIVSPVDLGQMRKLKEYLCQVQDLHLVLVSGSVDEGTAIAVSAAKPIPLLDILREMPPVEQVAKEGNNIQVMLKAG